MNPVERLLFAFGGGIFLAASVLNIMVGHPLSAAVSGFLGIFFALEAING